jgi:hypothetical protein
MAGPGIISSNWLVFKDSAKTSSSLKGALDQIPVMTLVEKAETRFCFPLLRVRNSGSGLGKDCVEHARKYIVGTEIFGGNLAGRRSVQGIILLRGFQCCLSLF